MRAHRHLFQQFCIKCLVSKAFLSPKNCAELNDYCFPASQEKRSQHLYLLWNSMPLAPTSPGARTCCELRWPRRTPDVCWAGQPQHLGASGG